MEFYFKEASTEENQLIQDRITDYNVMVTSNIPRADPPKKIDLVLYSTENELIGGINAEYVNWGILFVSLLFVEDKFRHQGYGGLLLKEVEERAKSLGCYLAHLDTFDFQGKEFYLKQGYSIFGVLEDCPKGHQRYYLSKKL